MKVYKLKKNVLIEDENGCYELAVENWNNFVNRNNLYHTIKKELKNAKRIVKESYLTKIETPIGNQEIWAAGVTYLRSKEARMEESKQTGGASFYDKVYDADRPELFFKANAHRVAGDNEGIHIRKDSSWNVPEPELTLFVNSNAIIQGYTIGNDVSSRSIEGENPLYLTQAKVYDRSAAIGPCLYITEKPISPDTEIKIEINRNDTAIYKDKVAIKLMKRSHQELVDYLFRECNFPHGVFLMTGTCLVPDDDITLLPGDEVRITIDSIGTLTNHVTTKK